MTDYNPDDDIAEALRRDGYDPDFDVRRCTTEERDSHRDEVIAEIDMRGLSVRPWMATVARGYHPETGEDLIIIGSHDEASRQMLSMVMPLWMARQVRDNLIVMINTVELLVAAGQGGESET